MSNSPSWCPDTFLNAYRFAAEAHRGQTVPGSQGLSYILHVSTVAMEVCAALTLETFERPNLSVQCALLHDAIEDTAVTYEDVTEHFGPEVADGVLALTKSDELDKPEAMIDSLDRIRLCTPDVWIVKLADRITNLQKPPSKWSAEKRLYYVDEAQIICDTLGSASPYLAGRIREKMETYRRVYCGDESPIS
jgi:(p)ppGpp synthase/HD superfamily hydrolase